VLVQTRALERSASDVPDAIVPTAPPPLLLGLVETAGVYLASSDIRLISSYAVLSLILVLKPSGLFGR